MAKKLVTYALYNITNILSLLTLFYDLGADKKLLFLIKNS